MPKPIWWILRVFHHVLFFYWGYTSVNVCCGRNFSARNGLQLPQGRQCSVKFVTPLWACGLQGGVHGINGFLPGNVSAVHLRGFGDFVIVADTLSMIVLPIAGGHGGVVISQKAADMHIASATTRTGYVARGIAGKDAASSVESHQTAAREILWGVYF